jgi:hypothetical protein
MSIAASLIRSRCLPASLDIAPPIKMRKYDWVKLKLLKDQRIDRDCRLYAGRDFVYTLAHFWKNPLSREKIRKSSYVPSDFRKGIGKEIPCAYCIEAARAGLDSAKTAKTNDIVTQCTYIAQEDLSIEEVFSATEDHSCSLISNYAKYLSLQKRIQKKELYKGERFLGKKTAFYFLEKILLVPDVSWDLNKPFGDNFRGRVKAFPLYEKNEGPKSFATSDFTSLEVVTLDELLTCENEFLRKRYTSQEKKEEQDLLVEMAKSVEKKMYEYLKKLNDLKNERGSIVKQIQEMACRLIDPNHSDRGLYQYPIEIKRQSEFLIKRVRESKAKAFFETYDLEMQQLYHEAEKAKNQMNKTILEGEWLKDLPSE